MEKWLSANLFMLLSHRERKREEQGCRYILVVIFYFEFVDKNSRQKGDNLEDWVKYTGVDIMRNVLYRCSAAVIFLFYFEILVDYFLACMVVMLL